MRHVLLGVFCLLVAAGCATSSPAPAVESLLHDHLFTRPAAPIRAADVFAPSAEMKRYLAAEVAPMLAEKGRTKGLYDALYSKHLLKIDYDAAMTRNAAETFAARTGNCLSLAIMTAALAKELGLAVRYQAVLSEDLWTRSGGIYFSSRHVNVTLGRRHTDPKYHYEERNMMTIDFMPVGELQVQRAWVINEETVVAMYMNNRAAEVLTEGRAAEAYWWAREAARQDPGYVAAFNTLGVIYRRQGYPKEAEAALEYVLAREPRNTHAMANLAVVYGDQGRTAEAAAMSARLAQIQPQAPFALFESGMAAMKRGDYAAARDFFAREAERDPAYHEFQFWLGAAYVGLGDYPSAARHLRAAWANSSNRQDRELYAAKLAKFKGGESRGQVAK